MKAKAPTQLPFILLATALALGAGLLVGRGFFRSAAPETGAAAAAKEATADSGPLTDGKRYKLPVSKSQPSRGPLHALVTVVQFSDLLGPEHMLTDEMVRAVLHRNPEARLVFRHCPKLDSEDSVLAHEFARIAYEQAGKLWQVQERLLARTSFTRDEVPKMAQEVGLSPEAVERALEQHTHQGYVAADRVFAAKFGVREAPAFFVNGRRLLGEPTAERLERLIAEERAHAEAVLATGVGIDRLYSEIVKDGLWDITGLGPVASSTEPAQSM